MTVLIWIRTERDPKLFMTVRKEPFLVQKNLGTAVKAFKLPPTLEIKLILRNVMP